MGLQEMEMQSGEALLFPPSIQSTKYSYSVQLLESTILDTGNLPIVTCRLYPCSRRIGTFSLALPFLDTISYSLLPLPDDPRYVTVILHIPPLGSWRRLRSFY